MAAPVFCCHCAARLPIEAGAAAAVCPSCGGVTSVPAAATPPARPRAPRRPYFLFALLVVVAVNLGVAAWYSPRHTIYAMQEAARAGDTDRMSSYIDYPAFRESVKANFNAQLAKPGGPARNSGPLGAFGAILASTMVNAVVDAFVTPEAVAMLVKGETPELPDLDGTRRLRVRVGAESETSMYYADFQHFVVATKRKGSRDEPLELVLERRGLLSWRLAGIRIPAT